jgi:hypothetical protein
MKSIKSSLKKTLFSKALRKQRPIIGFVRLCLHKSQKIDDQSIKSINHIFLHFNYNLSKLSLSKLVKLNIHKIITILESLIF